MYVHVKYWETMCKQGETRAPIQYDEPLKSLTVNHLWQHVEMQISYMLTMENRYYLLLIGRECLSGWAEV
jgi:hypothetical protein